MPTEVLYAKKIRRQFDRAEANIKKAFINRRRLMEKDPSNPLLRNHVLKGEYLGFRIISVTGDWRALFVEKKKDGKVVVEFKLLGTHSQLYK